MTNSTTGQEILSEDSKKTKTSVQKRIYLKDYQKPPYLVPSVRLNFNIDGDVTILDAESQFVRNPEGPDEDLFLDGDFFELKQMAIDGQILKSTEYNIEEKGVRFPKRLPDKFTLSVRTRIETSKNTALEGLYQSGQKICTQCEAQGFRRMTYFLDRPDVLSKYTVRIESNREDHPTLLSNGNLVEQGDLESGRHYALWEDPFPKPCYLFALVAGHFGRVSDEFATVSGKKVQLEIYCEPGDEKYCGHAMNSLKKAMKWDEERYGLEYDLDRYMIVAIPDFTGGAMENKGLNIFNSALVLADPQTSTDIDYQRIESVVAHEYFHNWTGNRVTCRDWFQLSLKEGLTVYRDQEFSTDVGSPGVERVNMVNALRLRQFPEDSGPTAHPVRPESCIAVDNFFTTTIYEKGAELIRMIEVLIGREAFRRGMDKYFELYDGQAVTTEDFVYAMEQASGKDLSHFKLWYSQSGTPTLEVQERFNEGEYTLVLRQSCPPTPDQPNKEALYIPIRFGLLGQEGKPLELKDGKTELTLELTKAEQSFSFKVDSKPTPSLLRGFSAPVHLQWAASKDDLTRLITKDTDPFVRWDMAQKFYLDSFEQISATERLEEASLPPELPSLFQSILLQKTEDLAFQALLLQLPRPENRALLMPQIDPLRLHQEDEFLRTELFKYCQEQIWTRLKEFEETPGQDLSQNAMGRRSLASTLLSHLCAARGPDPAWDAFQSAKNMTEELAALSILVQYESDLKDKALDLFFQKWQKNDLVLNKWFAIQASSRTESCFTEVKKLYCHPRFNKKNPNKVYHLILSFGANLTGFHIHPDSYDWLAEVIVEIDQINPQVAARLFEPLRMWRKLDPSRRERAKTALQGLTATQGLSGNCFEIAEKSLL